MRQKKIENRCLLDKMVPKHLLQLIFLSVICIFSFKILELRFRHELYDSNDILGKEWQKRPFKAIWAVQCRQAGRLKNSANFLKYLSYFWRSFFFTFSLTKKYNITVSLHRSSALKCWYKREKTVNFGFEMYFFGRNRLTKLYCIYHSLLNISLYDPSAEAKLAPIFVTNTAINVTLMQQVMIHVL